MIPISRISTPRPRIGKYQYKTSHTTSRCDSTLPLESSTLKKDSRVKTKKQLTESSLQKRYSQLEDFRVPLGQHKTQDLNTVLDLSEYHKKESSALKKKNYALQQKIKTQNKQMQQLKQQLQQIKTSVKQNVDHYAKESEQLKNVNTQLHQRFQNQVHQIGSLRKQILSLKQFLTVPSTQIASSNIAHNNQSDPHQVSRRVEYVQHYEAVVGNLKESNFSDCAECIQKDADLQQIRVKYNEQLRSLQDYVSFLKEKQLMVQILEKQVNNKNQCIDYLRNQLEIVQCNSNKLLGVIQSLERRVEDIASRNVNCSDWDKVDESFHSFSGYKY